jgi:hypothetical protein
VRVVAREVQRACHALDEIIRDRVLQTFGFSMNIIPRIP